MKLTFQTGRAYRANTLERGDKYDKSVVHWLSALPGEVFLVERWGGSWMVTTGQVMTDTPVMVDIPIPVKPAVTAKTKPKQPKKKKR